MSEFMTWLAGILAVLFPNFGGEGPPVYTGYVEGNYVHVAPLLTRQIVALEVTEGEAVAPGDVLFELDDTRETAALRAAQARQAAAEANLHNLETGSRDAEIDVINAALEQALADQALARSNLTRSQSLFEREIVTSARVDTDSAALDRANAAVAQLHAQLEVAQLPARDEQLAAARAGLEAAAAETDQAASALEDLTVTAPVGGVIDTLYYDAGEVAQAGRSVLSILPPGAITVLFYLPETDRMGFAIGQSLTLTCDGCPPDLSVTITRLDSAPQYTPPVIYSRDERARLVFRAEARLDRDVPLLPGQPVTLERP